MKRKQFDLQETFSEATRTADAAYTYRFVGRDQEAAAFFAKASLLAVRCVGALPDDAPSKAMALHAAAKFSYEAGSSADALRFIGCAERLELSQRDVIEFGRLRAEINAGLNG